MAKPKNYYTSEFKMAILSQIESGVPITQDARENGLHPTLVVHWKKEYMDVRSARTSSRPQTRFRTGMHPQNDRFGIK